MCPRAYDNGLTVKKNRKLTPKSTLSSLELINVQFHIQVSCV